jgi:hypothetical protein
MSTGQNAYVLRDNGCDFFDSDLNLVSQAAVVRFESFVLIQEEEN